MKGQHKPGYRWPAKGQRRKTDQPMKLDRLSQDAREAIQKARAAGKTWEETSELASEAAGQAVSESACRRWYDVRVSQVQKEILAQAESSRALAAEFAAKGFKDLPEATVNALGAEVFALTEAGTPVARQEALGHLLFLLSKLITAQTGQKKLELEQEKLELAKQRLEQMRAKVGGLKEAVAGKKKVSSAELQKKIDEIYGLAQSNP